MKISYELRLVDVVAFQKHLLMYSKQHRLLKNLTRLIVPIVMAGIILFKVVNETGISQTQIFLFGGIAILWLILHHLFFEKIMFRKVEKTVEAQKEALGLGKNSVELTESGIDFWQNKENLLLPFKRFARIDETATHLFLVVGEFAGIAVSKETADNKNFEKFVNKFREKI